MEKVCPLRMMAIGSDWDTIANLGSTDDPRFAAVHCIHERCAWWNARFEQCSLTALASVSVDKFWVTEIDPPLRRW